MGVEVGLVLRDGELGGVQAVHQHGAVRLHLGVRVVVGQGDGQLLHLDARAHVLHGVLHLDVHILGQGVDLAVALVPQLQGLVAVKLRVPDGLVQIPDVFQDLVGPLHVLGQILLGVLAHLLQTPGVVLEQRGEGFRRAPDQGVVV